MEKLKIGIIGAGRIGNVHAQSITYAIPEAEVAAVTDVKEEMARALAEKYGIPKYGSDYHMILSDPEIDAVMVCSPTPTHAEISIAAMEAGKHVFCEKPVDMTIEKIRATAEAAERDRAARKAGSGPRTEGARPAAGVPAQQYSQRDYAAPRESVEDVMKRLNGGVLPDA